MSIMTSFRLKVSRDAFKDRSCVHFKNCEEKFVSVCVCVCVSVCVNRHRCVRERERERWEHIKQP